MAQITVGCFYPSITDVSGITATVSSTYAMTSGQYIDGSPWIAPTTHDPFFSAAIVSTTPPQESWLFNGEFGFNGYKDVNGIMMNVPGHAAVQGYDERANARIPYVASYNQSLPLSCVPHDMVVMASGIPSSVDGLGGVGTAALFSYALSKDRVRTVISCKMPLTFLDRIPPLDTETHGRGGLEETLTFRPGAYWHQGRINNKIQFYMSEFDASRIPQFLTEEQPGGGNTFSGYYAKIFGSVNTPSPVVKPYWEDLYNAIRYYFGDDNQKWGSEAIHAGFHQPGYGQGWGELINLVLLKSLMIVPESEQELRTKTLKALTQAGIDYWSAWKDGRDQKSNGGHFQAKKAMIMAAGVLLNNEEMKDPDRYLGPTRYDDPKHDIGLGRFGEAHTFCSGQGHFSNPWDPRYGVGRPIDVITPSALFNGWYWGDNHTATSSYGLSACVGFQQLHPSGGKWDTEYASELGPGLSGISPWYPGKSNTPGRLPIGTFRPGNAPYLGPASADMYKYSKDDPNLSQWRTVGGNYGDHFLKYGWTFRNQSSMGQALFMQALGLGPKWSLPLLGWTTQNTYGWTRPFYTDATTAGFNHLPNARWINDYESDTPSMFPGSSVTINSYGISGLVSGDDRNYIAYYYRKYRISNELLDYQTSNSLYSQGFEKVIGMADFSGPYLATNEDATFNGEGGTNKVTWEIFQCPPNTTCKILGGEILSTPSALGNGQYIYVDQTPAPAQQSYMDDTLTKASRYGTIIHRMAMPPEPYGGPFSTNGYGIQAVFYDQNDLPFLTTNAYKMILRNDSPFPDPGPPTRGIVSESEAEVLTSNKIGTPIVRSYGSSYGKYGGNKLKDYDTPRPDDLNNKDAKGTVEFKDFQRTIKDYILSRLGYPVVDVELEDFQIETCIDEAISRLEYHAPDWMTQYATFQTSGGINVYDLPAAVADNLNDVWYKRDFFKFGASPGSLEYDFAIMFFTNTGLFNNYNVSQYLLMQQYLKQVKNVLGQMSTWQLIGNRYLHVWPVPENNTETVLLEFRAFDPKTIHHAYKNWVERFSLCLAKEILGGIRNKYQTLPGPGGGTKLNGDSLIREAALEKEKLLEELVSGIEGPPLFDIT